MNWVKTLQHDIQRGLFRWRYLAGLLLFTIPCVELLRRQLATAAEVTWIDYIIACFQGVSLQAAQNRQVELPITWLLIMAGANLISLDYFFRDIAREGQQVLIRCKSRVSWYLSKCVWNIMSSSLYLLIGMITAAIFTMISGGRFALENTPELISAYFSGDPILPVRSISALLTGVLAPWATICTLNMIQMTLLLFIKPIYSFLVCMVLLLSAAYIPSGWLIGNGAMTHRCSALMGVGVLDWQIWTVLGVLMVGSLLLGIVRIRKMDFLAVEV